MLVFASDCLFGAAPFVGWLIRVVHVELCVVINAQVAKLRSRVQCLTQLKQTQVNNIVSLMTLTTNMVRAYRCLGTSAPRQAITTTTATIAEAAATEVEKRLTIFAMMQVFCATTTIATMTTPKENKQQQKHTRNHTQT